MMHKKNNAYIKFSKQRSRDANLYLNRIYRDWNAPFLKEKHVKHIHLKALVIWYIAVNATKRFTLKRLQFLGMMTKEYLVQINPVIPRAPDWLREIFSAGLRRSPRPAITSPCKLRKKLFIYIQYFFIIVYFLLNFFYFAFYYYHIFYLKIKYILLKKNGES